MNQLSIAFAERNLGMARAQVGAENACPGWTDLAIAYLKLYAETHERFPMFFVTADANKDARLHLANTKAWGPVTRMALKRGYIMKTETTLPHPGRHACPAIVFRSLLYRGAA